MITTSCVSVDFFRLLEEGAKSLSRMDVSRLACKAVGLLWFRVWKWVMHPSSARRGKEAEYDGDDDWGFLR